MNKMIKTVKRHRKVGLLRGLLFGHSWRSWLGVVWLMIAPLVMVFLTELTVKQNFFITGSWMLEHPGQVCLAYALLLWFLVFFWLLFNNLGWATLLTLGSVTLLAVLNYFKIPYRGEPIYPQDFAKWREVLAVVSPDQLSLTPTMWGVIIATLFLIGLSFFLILKVRRAWLRWSAWSMMLCLGILIITTFTVDWWQKVFHFQYDFQHNKQYFVYQEHGLLTSFLFRTYDSRVFQPPNYSELQIKNLTKRYQTTPILPDYCSELSEPPLIIMVMSESWIDPNDLTKISFTNDVLPNYHRLQTQAKTGKVLVKTLGGGTSETEFEVLTGFSNSFHPFESEAYINYIKKPLVALPAIARESGYQTLAIHPYYDWFWRRNEVYPLLGFDKFLSLDDFDQSDPQVYRGNFISDKVLGDYIINAAKEPSEKPKLIWAVSMQNHCFYEDKDYGEADAKFLKYELPAYELPADFENETEEQLLKNYLIGAADADRLLGRLVAHFEKYEQPVIIAFFGDHWPMWNNGEFLSRMLGDDLSDLEKNVAMQQTPLVLWSNYEQLVQKEDLGVMSGFLVGPLIAQASCLPLTDFWQMLIDNRQYLTGYNLGINLLNGGELKTNADLPDELIKLKNDHWLWQYDQLMGKRYSVTAFKPK